MKRGVSGRDEAATQLAVLRQLNQQAAAELLGWTSRGLRDSDAPRDEKTRSYDGRRLVKWLLDKERKKLKRLDSQAINLQLQHEKLREAKRKNDVAEEVERKKLKAAVDEDWGAVGLLISQAIDSAEREFPGAGRLFKDQLLSNLATWERR